MYIHVSYFQKTLVQLIYLYFCSVGLLMFEWPSVNPNDWNTLQMRLELIFFFYIIIFKIWFLIASVLYFHFPMKLLLFDFKKTFNLLINDTKINKTIKDEPF